jgi:hypothetical protein
MAGTFNLANLSDEELNTLVNEATKLRDFRRENQSRENAVDADGAKGQDVRDPDHGVITSPTPREVREEGLAHGVPDRHPREVH